MKIKRLIQTGAVIWFVAMFVAAIYDGINAVLRFDWWYVGFSVVIAIILLMLINIGLTALGYGPNTANSAIK